MLTADKITELFCMADDFYEFFDKITAKYTQKDGLHLRKEIQHRDTLHGDHYPRGYPLII